MTHHLSKPHFGYLVNFTIMSWLFLTVVQFVVLNFFHKRNNLTNRFCSGFKVSDSVSVMTKFKFRWQNRCWDKMMVVTKNPVRHPSPTSVTDIDVVTGSPYIWPDLDVVPVLANFRGMIRSISWKLIQNREFSKLNIFNNFFFRGTDRFHIWMTFPEICLVHDPKR